MSLLEKKLKHEVSVFVGQSGVGKSSLISALLPHEEGILTNQISSISELGKHTTSNSRYYHLPQAGALIDSPGVREFSLSDVDASTLVYGYYEFKPYLLLCKFRNCTHINTTECAIIDAVERGLISHSRYENFKKLYLQFSQSHIK